MTEIERREFLKSTGAALAGVAGVGVLTSAGCVRKHVGAEIQNPTRTELANRLQQLGESKPPSNLKGAMCYAMLLPVTEKQPCPACGRTMVVGRKDEILHKYNIPLKRIQDREVDAKLIIPEHCPECGFGLQEEKFHLEIKYPDQRDAVRVKLDDAFDLELMALFLQGADRFDKGRFMRWSGGHEQPLKDKVERLRELFGVNE